MVGKLTVILVLAFDNGQKCD